ncbi:ImmA/IrrE family metallo-endopeptidase [Coleofasciculus chthonoplastes]|uniref:ImmA/IrrE family metallo-endopeptidase n=1 Tax=Coleofasciculus chthonoplastes TaxID=64178 RepID=UPI0032F69F11
MNSLSLNFDWLTSGNDSPEIQQTMGMFGLRVVDISLTQNEDTFSKTIRDTVLVSAYPLAAWIASSWWRLIFEPLPPTNAKPSVNWRMAHELTAANQGFIWPRVILASDTELMQIWSTPSKAVEQQSVRYINGLEGSCPINLHEFELKAEKFIETVLSRLNATGVRDTPLANLWQELQEERSDAYSSQYRRCEAELGFDPDECPESLVEDTLNLAKQIGSKTLSELAPACSKDLSEAQPLSEILKQIQSSGLKGNPDISIDDSVNPDTPQAPWQRGNKVASLLRDAIDIRENSVPDDTLYDLLGLKKSEYEAWTPTHRQRQHISVAVPLKENRFNFHPRKKHPIAKRFELARLIGDYLFYGNRGESWLTSTDLRTSRQKYQRAFAAEFLCPLSSLQDYLDNDYSESAIEDAGDYFQVSSQTVESILANNGLISSPQSVSDLEASLPY